MENYIATTCAALIVEEGDQFYFLQKGDTIFRLAKDEGEHAIGDVVTGFVYTDKENHSRITTVALAATQETFGWGVVTDVRKDLGVFVDTGLPGKDVVVSLDDLPLEKEQWPKKGDQLYVKLVLDRKARIWGHLAWHVDFWQLAQAGYDNMNNQNLRAIVYRNKESGTFVYLPDHNMLGFIHPNERFSVPRVGQELQVRVIGFRKEHRSLNLSAKPRAYEMLDADSQMLLAYLQSMGGKKSFNDKSNPEEIKATFGISKGQFKKALGGLMKQGKIKQSPQGTTLSEEA